MTSRFQFVRADNENTAPITLTEATLMVVLPFFACALVAVVVFLVKVW